MTMIATVEKGSKGPEPGSEKDFLRNRRFHTHYGNANCSGLWNRCAAAREL